METISLKDLNNSKDLIFHFTLRENIESISEKGIIPSSGGASKMIGDRETRAYFSRGYIGILAIKNSFIYEFSKLRVCDIPIDYREYFNIKDYSSEEIIDEKVLYDGLEKKFKDEVYLVCDLKEGEDFLLSEVRSVGFINNADIRSVKNKVIEPNKLRVITDNNEPVSAYDMVFRIYDKMLNDPLNKDKETAIRTFNSSLDKMYNYLLEKKNNHSVSEGETNGR